MKDESRRAFPPFYFHPSAFILHPFLRRRSQVVRQRSAKPLFIGSIPIAASNLLCIASTHVSAPKTANPTSLKQATANSGLTAGVARVLLS